MGSARQTADPLGGKQLVPVMTPAEGGSQPRKKFAALLALLLLGFAKPLFGWANFAVHDELFSYVLLIPFVSVYLVWLQRKRLAPAPSSSSQRGLLVLGIGLALLLGYWLSSPAGFVMSASSSLTWTTLSFYICFLGVCFLTFSSQTLQQLAFPLGFLAFIVPFPDWLTDWLTTFLQHTSALAAHLFFTLTGMPVFRQDLVFQLPGMRLEVAPECSGIHSTLALLILSLLAGQVFLRSPWSRTVLALAVIPLGILRNGFRIWTIGELCVHISPAMINSPIHRRGGPIFFLASLIPLFLLLVYLRKLDSNRAARSAVQNK